MNKEYTALRRFYACTGFIALIASPFLAAYLVHLNTLINQCLNK